MIILLQEKKIQRLEEAKERVLRELHESYSICKLLSEL